MAVPGRRRGAAARTDRGNGCRGDALLRLHDGQFRRADHGVGGESTAGVRHHGPGASDAGMEPLPGSEPAAPRRVLPCDPWRVPARCVAGQPHQARGANAIHGGHVSADLLDATRRPPGHGDPPTGAAAHQSSSGGGRSPMRATALGAPVAALCAACLQRADRTPPASDTSAVPDTTATPATPAPAAVPTPPPPPSPGATKLIVVEGFLTPESVLHDPAQDIYFVSNINGGPTTKDNNRVISPVRPDGAVANLKFIGRGPGGGAVTKPQGGGPRGGR